MLNMSDNVVALINTKFQLLYVPHDFIKSFTHKCLFIYRDMLATGCEDKNVRVFYLATNSEQPLKVFSGINWDEID